MFDFFDMRAQVHAMPFKRGKYSILITSDSDKKMFDLPDQRSDE